MSLCLSLDLSLDFCPLQLYKEGQIEHEFDKNGVFQLAERYRQMEERFYQTEQANHHDT